MKKSSARDIEKNYPLPQFIEKIRRLADALEAGEPFTIQVANERIAIPKTAVINIEHERGGSEEELEFQLVWKKEATAKKVAPKRTASKKSTSKGNGARKPARKVTPKKAPLSRKVNKKQLVAKKAAPRKGGKK